MSSEFAGKRVTLRCPKCKSTNFQLTEVVEENVIYEVVNGVMPANATDHEPGCGICLAARFSGCGHEWKPRATLLGNVVED